jgi:hypothetical protein
MREHWFFLLEQSLQIHLHKIVEIKKQIHRRWIGFHSDYGVQRKSAANPAGYKLKCLHVKML